MSLEAQRCLKGRVCASSYASLWFETKNKDDAQRACCVLFCAYESTPAKSPS